MPQDKRRLRALFFKEAIITQKQQNVALLLFILSTVCAGIAWNGFLKSNSCAYLDSTIQRHIDDISDFLINYAFIASPILDKERKKAFEKIIVSKELPIKRRIEDFKETCHTELRKMQLRTMLTGFQFYFTTKQAVFKEDQRSSFRWIQKNYPYEDDDLSIEAL